MLEQPKPPASTYRPFGEKATRENPDSAASRALILVWIVASSHIVTFGQV